MNSSRKIARTLTAFIVVCISVSIFDTGAHSAAPGSSSVQALRTGVGARPAALGNAYVGVTGDLYTMNWNPAGISFLTATEAAASHSSLIADVSHTYAAVGVPVGSLVFGLSINYIDYGSAGQRFEIAGVNPTAIGGTLEPSAAVVSGTLAKKFTEQFAAGVNLKAVNVDLVDQSSTAVAFDAGAVYSFSSQFTLGAAVRNIGTTLKFQSEKEKLPLTASIGANYTFTEFPFGLFLDADFPNDDDVAFHAGAEYTFREILSLRLGYSSEFDAGSGLAGGVGLMWRNWNLDYSIQTTDSVFSSVHRLSLSSRFGESE